MKNAKKVLSVLLALTMIFGVFAIVASAGDVYAGPEKSDCVNVKLEVVQVAATAADSDSGEAYEAVDNDIYAVTVYAKTPATLGLTALRTCIKYDETKFQPILSYDGSDVFCGQDHVDETGEEGTRIISYPARFSDTRYFDDAGVEQPKAGTATVIMLGKTAAYTGFSKTFEYKTDGEFVASNTSTQGVMFCELYLTLKNKGAFLNTVDGVLNTSDYLEMWTLYFQRQVDEDQVYGSEFGINAASDVGTDCVTLSSGGKASFIVADAPDTNSQDVNYVSNAVEAPIKPLVALTCTTGAKAQAIAFNLAAAATPTYTQDDIESVDYRFVAQFSTTAFPIDYNPDGTVNSTDIDEVGYVMAKAGEATANQLTAFDAAGIAGLSKDSGTIRKCWTAKISTDMAGDAAFAFSCRIKGIAVTSGTVASEYIVVPYVLANGQVTYGTAQTSSVQAKYNDNYTKFLANKNA